MNNNNTDPARRRAERRASVGAENTSWTLRLQTLRLLGGRSARLLLIVDDYTGTSPGVAVREDFGGWDVVEALNDATRRCGLPRGLRINGEAEFGGAELAVWVQVHGIRLLRAGGLSPATSPAMAAFREAIRGECLNRERLASVDEAQDKIDAWRRRFNAGTAAGEPSDGDGNPGEKRLETSAEPQDRSGPSGAPSVMNSFAAPGFRLGWSTARTRG